MQKCEAEHLLSKATDMLNVESTCTCANCDFNRHKWLTKIVWRKTTDEEWEKYAAVRNGLNLTQAFYKTQDNFKSNQPYTCFNLPC